MVTTSGAPSGLRPEQEVIVPHDDVAQGRYGLAEFAADLHQVAADSGGAICDLSEEVQELGLDAGVDAFLEV
jgi:hypothetical protein